MSYIKMDYYDTYYFSDVCSSIIKDTFSNAVVLNGFWGEGEFENFLTPFPKYSVLHKYIYFCIEQLIFESKQQLESLELPQIIKQSNWIDQAMKYHDLEYENFQSWLKNKDSNDYPDDLLNEYFNLQKTSIS
jgi:hypothetical protein